MAQFKFETDFRHEGTMCSWEQLIAQEAKFARTSEEWVFRGDSEARPLKTTLERAWERFAIPPEKAYKLERLLFADFQRNYPIHSQAFLPGEDDTIHWLSLMAHYGAPTRLLDFTYSFFTAAFFALEDAEKKRAKEEDAKEACPPALIWCISKTWLGKPGEKLLLEIGGQELYDGYGKREGWAFEKVFWRDEPLSTVLPVNPSRFHERLYLHQGLFLCPGNLAIGFEMNLKDIPDRQDNVRYILIDSRCRDDILLKLHRAGTNRAKLFPGLDGFAKSLGTETPLIFKLREEMETCGARPRTNDKGDFKGFGTLPGSSG